MHMQAGVDLKAAPVRRRALKLAQGSWDTDRSMSSVRSLAVLLACGPGRWRTGAPAVRCPQGPL